MIIKNEDYEGPAVYQIVNQSTNKKYIGSSINYAARAKSHLSDLKAGRHYNKALQNDFNEDNSIFVIEIIRNYAIKVKNEMFSKEYEHIKAAKDQGEELYNIAEMRRDYYLKYDSLLFKMADLFSMEHFGVHAGQLHTMPPAKIEMYYYLYEKFFIR